MKKFSSLLVVLLFMLASFSAHAQGYPRGDVDRDGSVNISDVTCLIDNLLNGISEGDVDQDGAVNISDATCLIDYLLQGTWPDDPVAPPDTHEYVDLGLPSGTLWATCNVGASSPEDCGDYFAWGETEPKGYYDWSTYKWFAEGWRDEEGTWHYYGLTKYCTTSRNGYYFFIDGKTKLDPEDDAAYVNWGPSWRMPTQEQLRELYVLTWRWTTRNGVNGRLFTGPNGNTLFLPAAGYRGYESLSSVGTKGYYWSRMLVPDPLLDMRAYCLFFNYDEFRWYDDDMRYRGQTVRAVRVP